MVVSSWLQKYFDTSKKWKRDDTKAKLDAIASQIDPAFSSSFESFKTRILDIVEETPEAKTMVLSELGGLDQKLKNSNRRHNLKKAAAIIDIAA